MSVFIRSQDRESIVMINSTIYLVPHLDGERVRIACGSDDLGDYESKERALEVLDEIQRILHPVLFMSGDKINIHDNDWVENEIIFQKNKDNFIIQQLSTYVYDMPKL